MAENFDPKKQAEFQRETIRLQKEYNDALKMSQSFAGAINDAISSQIDYRTQLGKKVKDYHKDLKSSISFKEFNLSIKSFSEAPSLDLHLL